MRILVTDGDARSALAATRALGRRGHEVFVASAALPSLASVSKFCRASDSHPDPAVDPAGFVEAIAGIVRSRQIELVMPMTEVTTLLLMQNATRLPEHCALPFGAPDSVAAAADKCEVLRLAAQLGVPAPRSQLVTSADDGSAAGAAIGYPLVLKPGRSRVWNGRHWISTSVAYASNAAELAEKLQRMPAEVFPVLAQERIEGPGVGVFLCCDERGIVASFAHRRIREKPPSGGQSVLSESIRADPVAEEHAAALLRALEWRGVAMVEFKRDLRDGSLRLMEINGRFWGSLQLAIDAGVDFPNILADLARGRRPATRPAYRTGVRCRWFWGDLDALLAVLLRPRRKLNLPPSYPGRVRALLEFLVPWRPGMRYELERIHDLQPALLELRRRLPFRRGT